MKLRFVLSAAALIALGLLLSAVCVILPIPPEERERRVVRLVIPDEFCGICWILVVKSAPPLTADDLAHEIIIDDAGVGGVANDVFSKPYRFEARRASGERLDFVGASGAPFGGGTLVVLVGSVGDETTPHDVFYVGAAAKYNEVAYPDPELLYRMRPGRYGDFCSP